MGIVRKQVKVGMAVVGLLGGVACAQGFDKPLSRTKDKAPEGVSSNSQTRIVTQDGDDEYEIVIQNGEISAKVNGKKIPAERIRRSKDKVEILDKDGDVVKSFQVAGTDDGQWRRFDTFGMGGMDPNAPKPKVMIGITMSENDDGVVVEHVYDGLPAAKAGLEVQDVIIAVDGAGDLDQKAFREALNKKEAGQKIKLKIKRDGKEKDITIELQKFDQQKLGGGAMLNWRPAEGMDNWQDAFKNDPEAKKRFEEAMKNMPEGGRAWVLGEGPDGPFTFTPFGGADSKKVEAMHSQMEKKIADLDKKLSRINEQMEKLEQLIQKLGERERGR